MTLLRTLFRKCYNPKLNYYSILGLPSHAHSADIQRAFHRLALQFHPDKNPQHLEKFKLVNEAYRVLSSEEREAYDKQRKQSTRPTKQQILADFQTLNEGELEQLDKQMGRVKKVGAGVLGVGLLGFLIFNAIRVNRNKSKPRQSS